MYSCISQMKNTSVKQAACCRHIIEALRRRHFLPKIIERFFFTFRLLYCPSLLPSVNASGRSLSTPGNYFFPPRMKLQWCSPPSKDQPATINTTRINMERDEYLECMGLGHKCPYYISFSIYTQCLYFPSPAPPALTLRFYLFIYISTILVLPVRFSFLLCASEVSAGLNTQLLNPLLQKQHSHPRGQLPFHNHSCFPRSHTSFLSLKIQSPWFFVATLLQKTNQIMLRI